MISTCRKWVELFSCLIVCLGAGGVGALLTNPEIDGWYRELAKPSWNPPNSVFAPVWTLLFILMGIALWRVRQSPFCPGVKYAQISFGIQLVLNVAWSGIFFAMHQPFWAFIEILFLWMAILVTLVLFFRVSRFAGFMLVPYLAWVTFATILNFSIWQLNLS